MRRDFENVVVEQSHDSTRNKVIGFLCVAVSIGIGYWVLDTVRYINGRASILDLGSTAQSLYLISHGHWEAFNTVIDMPTLLDIDSYILYIIAWPFRYFGGVYFLFALQSLAIVVFGIAMFEMSRSITKSIAVAFVFSFTCMISLPIIGGDWYDFHVDFVVLLGLSLSLLGFLRKKTYLIYVGILLALLSKNEAAIPIMIWAVVELFYKSDARKHWLAILLLSIFVFSVDEFVVPHLYGASMDSHLSWYSAYGNSMTHVMFNFLIHPWVPIVAVFRHWEYLMFILGPFAFLPLFSGLRGLPYIALIVLNDISSFASMRNIVTQYAVILVFFLALSCQSYLRLMKSRRRLTFVSVSISMAVTMIFSGILLSELIDVLPNSEATGLNNAVATVDKYPNASIWTQPYVGTALYNHRVYVENTYPQPFSNFWNYREQFSPDGPVILFVPTKTSDLLVNEAVWKGIANGYRIVDAQAGVVAFMGRSQFSVAALPASVSDTLEQEFKEPFPIYQPALLMNYTDAHLDKVNSSIQSDLAGLLANSYPIYLPTGRYRFSFSFINGQDSRQLGTVAVFTPTEKPPIAVAQIRGTSNAISLEVDVQRNTVVYATVYLNGMGQVNYKGFVVTKAVRP